MRAVSSLRCIALLTLACVAGAQTPATIPRIQFEKYTLPNGLQVILHVDRKLPVVHVNQWFHVGSSSERAGRSGFAHLFEHMMFQGSKNVGKYISELEVLGADVFQGGVNGTTDWDRTNYFATVPSGNLETLLWIEADRLLTLPDALTKEKLDNQRDVVKNERRQGLENQPYGKAEKLIMENIFPQRHPYANDVIGSHEDLTAASMDDVKDFFRTWYTPNNMSLVVAGDFDPAEAKKLIGKYFGGIPPGPPLDRPVKWIARLDARRAIEATDRVPQERVYLAWPTPGFFDKGDAELDIAANVLSDGLSSRLKKSLMYDEPLCSQVVAFQQTLERGGLFMVDATARPGVSLDRIEQIIAGEIARLAQSGPTADELSRAQAKWEYNFVSGLERIGGFGGKSDALNRYNTYLGDPGKFEADIARYRSATIDDVKQTVGSWLDTPNRLVVRFRPERSTRAPESTVDWTKRPPTGKDSLFQTPPVQTSKLSNGIDVFVVERSDLPKVAVTLATRAGSVRDPAGKDGLADLLGTVMRRGTKTRKALEIEDSLNGLGATLLGRAEREISGIVLQVLKRNLDPAAAILADVARNPSFPQEEVERERNVRMDALARQASDPGAIASRVSDAIAFGASHPYGRPRMGLPSSVSTLTREDMVQFHAANWKPGSSALIFAGDITMKEALALAEREFGSWSGGSASPVNIPPPSPMGPGKTFVVDRQDAAQTFVTQVIPAPLRTSPDYFAFALADAVYGGGFNTRLNLNLREQKGYSYGVFTRADLHAKASLLRAMGGVQTDKTKESVAEFRKELSGLAGDNPVTEKEMEDARSGRIRAFALRFESLNSIAGQIADLWAKGLPMTELQREPAEFQRLTLDAVNAVTKKYAMPGQTSTLLVGDWSKIGPGLKSLDLGEIVMLDVEGKPRK